jgi:hypothetical protein
MDDLEAARDAWSDLIEQEGLGAILIAAIVLGILVWSGMQVIRGLGGHDTTAALPWGGLAVVAIVPGSVTIRLVQ